LRQDEVIQPADVQHFVLQVERRFAIRRVEAPANRMIIGHHPHVEDLLDGRNVPGNVQQDAIGMGPCDHQTVLPSELDDRLIILIRGTEFCRKLLRAEIVSEIRASRI
jgi:hypothetical protein